MTQESQSNSSAWFKGRNGVALLVFLGVVGVYVLTEHWAHAAPYLPWLILLACPLMHVFMHRGHGSHGGHGSSERIENGASEKEQGGG